MNLLIHPVTEKEAQADANYVRRQVFEQEWNLSLPELSKTDPGRQLTLLARDASDWQPLAVLTVMETTGSTDLHQWAGLSFQPTVRAARYTQLAVLKRWRGMNLPVCLMLHARRQFVVPRHIQYTWLLFDAERARPSALCKLLGFAAISRVFNTEYGLSTTLSRNETAPEAELNDRIAQKYVDSGFVATSAKCRLVSGERREAYNPAPDAVLVSAVEGSYNEVGI